MEIEERKTSLITQCNAIIVISRFNRIIVSAIKVSGFVIDAEFYSVADNSKYLGTIKSSNFLNSDFFFQYKKQSL